MLVGTDRRPLRPDSVEAVVHLVASAVPDLAPAQVSVTDTDGTLLTADGSTSGGASRTLRAQQDTETAARRPGRERCSPS